MSQQPTSLLFTKHLDQAGAIQDDVHKTLPLTLWQQRLLVFSEEKIKIIKVTDCGVVVYYDCM